jgi:hypothetical protein
MCTRHVAAASENPNNFRYVGKRAALSATPTYARSAYPASLAGFMVSLLGSLLTTRLFSQVDVVASLGAHMALVFAYPE